MGRFAAAATEHDMVFSFNTNPGFDSIARRNVAPDSCYQPRRFEPETDELDWSSIDDRDRAHHLSERRITESLYETLRLQTDPCLINSRKGFLLVYVNSFNEWHEGHQFEPMKSRFTLSPAERGQTYHNAVDGGYRLRVLGEKLRELYG